MPAFIVLTETVQGINAGLATTYKYKNYFLRGKNE
jgi:hypothetical protein